MIRTVARVTTRLAAMLREQHDDETEPLHVDTGLRAAQRASAAVHAAYPDGHVRCLAARADVFLAIELESERGVELRVTRADGSELSDSEAAHVAAILAAHEAEPIR